MDSNSVIAAPAPPVSAAPARDVRGHVVAFINDDTNLNAVRAGLSGLADALELNRGNLRHAIRFFSKTGGAQALVVDIDGIDEPVATLEELARLCPPDLQVLVVGEDTDIGLYRSLINDLGVTEYVHKPLTRDVVQRFLLPHLAGGGTQRPDLRGGHIVVVCGAHGGAGATTIAVNLAIDLAGSAKSNVILLDLHLQGSAAARMLGVQTSNGLTTALEDHEQADALFLERAAITAGERLRLLAADEAFTAEPAVTESGLMRVLDTLRRRFNVIVVDLPMPAPPSMHRVLKLARQVVIVTGPDVAGLRGVRAVRELVRGMTQADVTLTVLNRADVKGGLARSLVVTGIGAPDTVIPDLGGRMLEAANLGVPAIQRVSALRRYLAPLLREIGGVRSGGVHTSFLGRILHR